MAAENKKMAVFDRHFSINNTMQRRSARRLCIVYDACITRSGNINYRVTFIFLTMRSPRYSTL